MERERLDMDAVLEDSYVEWTAPKDAQVGDRVFFMHAVTAVDKIRRLQRQLQQERDEIPELNFSLLEAALRHARDTYDAFGGCVFATGTVNGPIIEDHVARADGLHWRSIYYAPIGGVSVLPRPVPISEFRDFIKVSRTGAITKLDREQAQRLEQLAWGLGSE